MTTYWAARFLAAAELERRGCRVALSAEDAPGFDLSVTSATGEQFVVDVKGLACLGTPWLGIIKPRRRDLFYILVFVVQTVAMTAFSFYSSWSGMHLSKIINAIIRMIRL